MVYTPYCYLIGWSKENKFYYGARWAKVSKCLYESGCHPDDFWVTYHTTSNYVAEMIDLYGQPDVKEVRKIFSTAEAAIKHEKTVLKRLSVVNSQLWLNQNDSTGRGVICHSELTKARMSKAHKGKEVSKETREAISKALKGRAIPQQTRDKISEALTGRKLTEEQKLNRLGKNSGKDNYRQQEFTIVAIDPSGERSEYLFEGKGPFMRCINELGIDQKKLERLKAGEEQLVKQRKPSTRHPFKPGTKLSLIPH